MAWVGGAAKHLVVFNEYGVQIMSPHYRNDPEQAKLVHREQCFAAPAKPSQERPESGVSPAPPR
jgi:hypothetical protein